jgi:hypothetical protein
VYCITIGNAGLFLAAPGNTEQTIFSGHGDDKMSAYESGGAGNQNSRQFIIDDIHSLP